MKKLILFFDLFRKGGVVSDPATWKNRGAAVLAVTGLLTALNSVAKAYGYDLGFSEQDITQVAAGIAIVVGLLITYTTSDKVGILPTKSDKLERLQTEFKFNTQTQDDLRGGP